MFIQIHHLHKLGVEVCMLSLQIIIFIIVIQYRNLIMIQSAEEWQSKQNSLSLQGRTAILDINNAIIHYYSVTITLK